MNRIEIWLPAQVGDGPVGFVTIPDGSVTGGGADVGSAIDFAGALRDCVGVAAYRAADRLATFAPRELLLETPCPPELPGGANILHGGPVLRSLSRPSAAEPDAQPVVATGLNLLPTDVVEVGGRVVPTVFRGPNLLEFRPTAVPAGRREVVVRRGACRSNGLPLRVHATVAPGLPRVRPGDPVVMAGTGFAAGQMSVLLNTEPVHVEVTSPYRLEFRSMRPRRIPPAPNPVGETVTVEVLHEGAAVGVRMLTLDTYRIAVFGDSTVWGQGLAEPTKFTTLLGNRIDRQLAGTIGVYTVDRLAHSGAVLLPANGVPDVTTTVPVPPTTGEVPGPLASITAQVAAWAATPALAAQAAQFELVVLDGGANDVGIGVILDPRLSDADLVSATRRACRGVMAGVLNAARSTFSGASRIVVTGYYPIVSSQSNTDLIYGLLLGMDLLIGLVTGVAGGGPLPGFGHLGALLFKEWLMRRVADRSALFAATANAALAATIAGTGDPRLALAVPAFGPRNAIFAPDSYLWGVDVSGGRIAPLDPLASLRVPLCGGNILCECASTGHPTPAGAQAYFDAIEAVL